MTYLRHPSEDNLRDISKEEFINDLGKLAIQENNMIKWNYIMDKQPEHGRSIIQINPPYEGHYTIGMRNYDQNCTFDEVLYFCKMSDIPNPNFWWVYAEDFPFPDKM